MYVGRELYEERGSLILRNEEDSCWCTEDDLDYYWSAPDGWSSKQLKRLGAVLIAPTIMMEWKDE